MNVPSGWPLVLFKSMWFFHHKEASSGTRYKLSDEALAWLNELKEAKCADEDEAKEKLAQKLLGDQEICEEDIPVPSGRSKDMDISIKLACCLHVLKHSLSSLVESGTVDFSEIPLEISKLTFDASIKIVSTCRLQVLIFFTHIHVLL